MENSIRMARLVAHILDNRFEIGKVKFGFNAFLEIIPGFGDVVATLLSLYIIFLALKLHVPNAVFTKMITNVALTFFVGLMPFVGDAFYIFYKPNVRNVELLNSYINSNHIPENIPDLPVSR